MNSVLEWTDQLSDQSHVIKLPRESYKHAPTGGRVVQSVTCLATDASLTADPRVASSIRTRSHTFVEIDHEIISTIILLPSAESLKKGYCQLQAKVCVNCLFKLAQEKVWLGELTLPP